MSKVLASIVRLSQTPECEGKTSLWAGLKSTGSRARLVHSVKMGLGDSLVESVEIRASLLGPGLACTAGYSSGSTTLPGFVCVLGIGLV